MTLQTILNDITYKDWKLYLGEFEDGRVYVQVQFWSDRKMQKCRKWLLSPHMTKSEIVMTAFKAILSAEEHECRESFKYRGEAIFNSHIDVDELHDVACRVDIR